MHNVQFIVDSQGQKTAALVNLREHAEFWAEVLAEHNGTEEFLFLVDDKGERIAVLLEFEKHAELWEDLYFGLTTDSAENEMGISWEEFKERLEPERTIGV